MKQLKAIVLAAGEGKRMHSKTPKVLHKIMGRSMLDYVIQVTEEIQCAQTVVVVGHKGDMIREAIKSPVVFVEQKEQLGTGHAVKMAVDYIEEDDDILILYGDTPLVTKETIEAALAMHNKENCGVTVISARMENPTGYGRIVREKGKIQRIVEQRDATEVEQKIQECNMGIYYFNGKVLKDCLQKMNTQNDQHEFYLTDAIQLALESGQKAEVYVGDCAGEFLGVNDRCQLWEATKVMRNRINHKHMIQGVTLIDPESIYISAETIIGQDTVIYPNVIIEGQTQIGEGCLIGSNSKLVNMVLDDSVRMESSVALDSKIGAKTEVGPFAYVRPHCVIGSHCKVGDFVEVKNSNIGDHTKASHLTYIGDSDVGNHINFGCGTVTVNYDGKNKFRTVIQDNAFIGCNSNLVSPVVIGEGAFIAAGSTITDDVPEKTLAIARARQVVKVNWKRK